LRVGSEFGRLVSNDHLAAGLLRSSIGSSAQIVNQGDRPYDCHSD
jgi:hypothetical protein